MRYELMLPYQLRKAIDENWPVALALGVLEYHGEHLGLGMDTLVVERALQRLEKEAPRLVLLPTFYYGAASNAVAVPERNGGLDIKADSLLPVARDMFRALLRVGLRNIHVYIHHQSENFATGMPTDLAFKLASRQAIFEFLDKTSGEGWWGNEKMATYYSDRTHGADPFSWIQLHPFMDTTIINQFDFDHAGIGETSLMMALCPEAVDMTRHTQDNWYARTAPRATAEHAEKALLLVMEKMRREMGLAR